MHLPFCRNPWKLQLRPWTSPAPDTPQTPYAPAAEDAFSILDSLYQEAYKSRGLTYVVSPRGKIQYLFALLFQRAVYFLTNPYQAPSLREKSCHELLLRFAAAAAL